MVGLITKIDKNMIVNAVNAATEQTLKYFFTNPLNCRFISIL